VNRENGWQTPAIFHSAEYKSRSQLSGRRVLILGTGETGMDLAYEAVKAHAKEVVLCSRSGYVFLKTTRTIRRVLLPVIPLIIKFAGSYLFQKRWWVYSNRELWQ